MNYWLMKSEPTTYSIDTLIKMPKKTDNWEGVRNYQARNFMRDKMRKGDLAFFYHSNTTHPGIVGIMEIVRESYPDFSALDPESKYYDPKSTLEKPRWYRVDVQFREKFNTVIPLTFFRACPKLNTMVLLKPGNRLSITPVTKAEWLFIMNLKSNPKGVKE